jgi:anti-sigma factor RsiW
MKCEQSDILLHAFIDGELDARGAREFQLHAAECWRCASELRAVADIRTALSQPAMRYLAPANLRRRIEGVLPRARIVSSRLRGLLEGLTAGSLASAALAASLVMFITGGDQGQFVTAELVSAHLRSLQSNRLIDVQSSDQHTVKPWFNGKLAVSPPVIDLAAEGFTLIGGRLDYIEAQPVATLVYKRRAHLINVFIAQTSAGDREGKIEAQFHGFNIWRGSKSQFAFSAVSDINPAELKEFGTKFEAAMPSGGDG